MNCFSSVFFLFVSFFLLLFVYYFADENYCVDSGVSKNLRRGRIFIVLPARPTKQPLWGFCAEILAFYGRACILRISLRRGEIWRKILFFSGNDGSVSCDLTLNFDLLRHRNKVFQSNSQNKTRSRQNMLRLDKKGYYSIQNFEKFFVNKNWWNYTVTNVNHVNNVLWIC